MWGDSAPSGREQAIETLVDMEPQGPFHRAARVLEESVPQALLQRPNLVTKSALVEQAYALSKYEIDQLAKYDRVFGEQQNACFSDRLRSVGTSQKERILKHHAKILAAKRGKASKAAATPTPQLVAGLRHVYGENESGMLRALLQSVMDHPAFSKSEEEEGGASSVEEKNAPGTFHLESLISSIGHNENDGARLHGLLISVLSVATGFEVRDSTKLSPKDTDATEASDPTAAPPLQVGAVLSLVNPEENDRNPWALDSELLSYLGQAAAVYEERIEVQKTRFLARLDDASDKPDAQTTQQEHQAQQEQVDQSTAGTIERPTPSTPQPVDTPPPEAARDVIAIPEDADVQNEIDAAAAALSAAVFEQMISAAAAGDSSDDGDSSDSDSNHDSDFEETEQHEDNSDSSSSSSSEAEPGGGQPSNGEAESDEDDEDDTNEDTVLRQALALSLSEQAQGLRIDTATAQDTGLALPPDSLTPGPVTPGSETPVSIRESTPASETDDIPLPPIPQAPKEYPYAPLLDTTMDSDQVETQSPYFDPAALNRFGTLPAPHVLVHLLRYTLETLERMKFQGLEEKVSGSRTDIPRSTISGGIGSCLFPPNHPLIKSQNPSLASGNEAEVSLQLLVSLFLLVVDRRNDAVEKFKKAVAQEKRTTEVEGDQGAGEDGGSGTPTSEEGDDPAIALALTYIDENTAESKESLEAKGMHRKAAAAAHDAAALLESLRRQTNSWKERVKLFSFCTLLSMKCLRVFLQYIVRRWLQERQGTTTVDCHKLLPTAVISKLSMGLASLYSASSNASISSLMSGDEGDLDEVFLPLKIYQEALLLWGESVPIVYPSVATQAEILRSLLGECSRATSPGRPRSLEKLTSRPRSDLEPNYHRLEMICRRLRVSDLLDTFVSSPACYLPDSDDDLAIAGEARKHNAEEPHCASLLISLIGSAAKAIGGIKGELQYLYLSLCHRCHVRVLLWDGLYACMESETNEAAVALTPPVGDSVRVSTNPSNNEHFDSTMCSDSMAIIANHGETSSAAASGSSVHQRASKVWGTVLSSTCFNPKTGVHRWAVRLDKCERGHVFVGVATSQASMRTYVGGDKYGWGMIGTQALWHDRRKIRGDYGATFRTGSTIVVTLDTDAGTLSFSSWKDGSSSNSFSLDPMVQNLTSPRRHGHVGGTLEDWGVAFEGLPLDSRLYPAVGLYQRDDRVTLLSVESGSSSAIRENAVDLSGGLCYYPQANDLDGPASPNEQISKVQSFNDLLSWDGIQYTKSILDQITECVQDGTEEFYWTTLLPSLASALCLVPPTIPMLSERCALALLPALTKCILELTKYQDAKNEVQSLFRKGFHEGKWVIRATGSSGSGSDAEEYVVDCTPVLDENGSVVGFEGTGVGTTGKSKNGLVAIFGTVTGSSIHFVEEWTDGSDEGFNSISADDAASSCVVTARLSLDGKKFEGTYRNVQFGTTGQIAGLLCDDTKVSKIRLKEAPSSANHDVELSGSLAASNALLCLAHSHLATLIGEDAASDHSIDPKKPADSQLSASEWQDHSANLLHCLSLPLFSRVSCDSSNGFLETQLDKLQQMYAPPQRMQESGQQAVLTTLKEDRFQESVFQNNAEPGFSAFSEELESFVAVADSKIRAVAGGAGSLAVLCREEYDRTRVFLVCALLHHSRSGIDLKKSLEMGAIPTILVDAWRTALRIMEDGVRGAITSAEQSASRTQARRLCQHYEKIAKFLLSLETSASKFLAVDEVAAGFSELFQRIRSDDDVAFLEAQMSRSTQRALLRLIPIQETVKILSATNPPGDRIEGHLLAESLAIAIPRVLGRGWNFSRTVDVQDNSIENGNLGVHYLCHLPGVSAVCRDAIQKSVHRLLGTLTHVAESTLAARKQVGSSDSMAAIDSLMLAILPSFTTVLDEADLQFVVLDSAFMDLIIGVVETHKGAIYKTVLSPDNETAKGSVVRELHGISHRDVSRSVLKALASVAHVVMYQAFHCDSSDDRLTSRCLDVLRNEISVAVPIVENVLKDSIESSNHETSEAHWERWCEQAAEAKSPGADGKGKLSRDQVGRSGLRYLHEHGMGQLGGAQTTIQKPSTRRGASQTARRSPSNATKMEGSFGHQFLSQWLHVMVAASKVPRAVGKVAKSPRWMHTLYGTVGLAVDNQESSGGLVVDFGNKQRTLIPARYRSRIVRLLLPYLEAEEASSMVAQGLFGLAGRSALVVSKNFNEDEGVVAREVVSLLRHLHAPSKEAWRSCINQVMSEALASNVADDDTQRRKLGVLLFFNGAVESLSRGSFVLLKPAAAVPLSVDQQSTSSSKGHSGSGGSGGNSSSSSTPHHIVGNGTEGIVAGLCRADASAGIVSTIDMKNGVCEVILLNRNSQESGEGIKSNKTGYQKGQTSSRSTLTVRALRSPVSDVVNAQEIPLFLDGDVAVAEALCSTLKEAVGLIRQARFITVAPSSAQAEGRSLAGSKSDSLGGVRSGVINVSYAMMAVRSSISVLADRQVLQQFLECTSAVDLLSDLLRIAYPEESPDESRVDLLKGTQKKFLSSLPVHEARWYHLLTMFRGLSSRMKTLEETPKSVWDERFERYKRKQEEESSNRPGAQNIKGAKDGYSTPPAEASRGSVTPPILGGGGRANTDGVSAQSTDSAPRTTSQSTAGSENSEDDDDSEAAATAAAHLREAAIAQMAELGLPRSWSELALRRTGGTNIEAAVHFCLERGGEMERLLAEERERERLQRQSSSGSSSRRRGNRIEMGTSNHLLRQLMEMGFPSRWCAEALAATGNNVDEALTWILTNGERLSAEDEGIDEGEDDDDVDEDDDDESQEEDGSLEAPSTGNTEDRTQSDGETKAQEVTESVGDCAGDVQTWKGSILPLRFISGHSIIDPQTLAISGLPTGGFSSVGTKGVLLTSGKWYYEAILETAGCLQIGWADGSFAGHCRADRGDGCGDGPSSWAYDGWRRYRWHATATEWGCRWKEGDVIGCMVDMDEHIVSFTLNGRGEEIGMGVAFSGQGFRPCGGVYACVSFNRREKLRLILGGSGNEPFRHTPPPGYKGVGEAVLNAVKERDALVAMEELLDQPPFATMHSMESTQTEEKKRFLCDFSDGEHGHELMAWAHRYYGSDASVHLGSGRSKHTSGIQKGASSSSSSSERSSTQCLEHRIREACSKHSNTSTKNTDAIETLFPKHMERCFVDVGSQLAEQTLFESLCLSSLLARKLLLHVMVTMGQDFDPMFCLSSDESKSKAALRLWKMVEVSASLSSAGWVGEAGAMAIAAEALGLGISSNDSSSARHALTDRAGLTSISDLDDGMLVPAAGIVQLLSSVQNWPDHQEYVATDSTLAACSEATIGSDGGGVLVFLLRALQSSVRRSEEVREVVIATVRRSIRLLGVVEYDGEDSASESQEEDDDVDRGSSSGDKRASSKLDESNERDHVSQPDARLVSFLTGLMLSPDVEQAVAAHDEIRTQLFEAWSVGLLSANLPWRMVCAFTASAILNTCPRALARVVETYPTLALFYGRLSSTVARRVWAERAAVPVCSRYSQAMIELLCSVKRSVLGLSLPDEFMKVWGTTSVDASTPLPIPSPVGEADAGRNWEAEDGWVSSDSSWEIWTGTVELVAVEWKTPSPSAVRTLMDGGDGPPMLREGCTVMRGLDWAARSENGQEDGKALYESEKAKRDAERSPSDETTDETSSTPVGNADPTEEENNPSETAKANESKRASKKKKKKLPSPKQPIGTVLSIEPWNGIPAMARRVRWHLTGEEGVYRYGGDGGRFDIVHVEVNEKGTRIRKRHPLPESAEQCAARHGFGAGRHYSVLLRLRRLSVEEVVDGEVEIKRQGILEWPDFGAGVLVDCILHTNGSVTLCEKELLYGSKDSGWEARFGQPCFVPGTVVAMSPTEVSAEGNQAELDTKSPYLSMYEELVGSSTFQVPNLRNRDNGGKLHVASKYTLLRGLGYNRDRPSADAPLVQAPLPAPIHFDRQYHASSLDLSRDGRTVSCISSDGRGTAFASIGFTKGVHYWEVKLEQADIGSVFIGVAEKPTGGGSGSSSGYDTPPRLNRWQGCGFVNFRATFAAGAERIYGAHCHAGDTVGVLLDCDAGRISFFFDGLKYGEHILNDLGCAFENISPFGFNVDGCGSGGAGQGAPSGIDGGRSGRYSAQGTVRPRALWPVVGLRNKGDRVTISSKWSSSYGIDGTCVVNSALALDEILHCYTPRQDKGPVQPSQEFPDWFINEAFADYRRWQSGGWSRTVSRGSGPFDSSSCGLELDLDASPLGCAAASALLGLKQALLARDRIRLKRSAGRVLELAEEAVVLGAYQGRLYYRVVSQKSEGGSLTEGGGRAWCWDESEVVDGLIPLGDPNGFGIELPLMERFKCTSQGGLRIVYEGGAVVRSDLEIFDGSAILGTIPVQTIIPKCDVVERRVNSCGVVRFRVKFEQIEGWISSRIRGGEEEAIVAPVHGSDEGGEDATTFRSPLDCARAWHKKYEAEVSRREKTGTLDSFYDIPDSLSFKALVEKGFIPGMSMAESDSVLARAVCSVGELCSGGSTLESPFVELATALSFAFATRKATSLPGVVGSPSANQAAATAFSAVEQDLPPIECILARVSVLRALNRRARASLPRVSLRPSQEGSAILGGIYGHGASIERAGRYWNTPSASTWVQAPSTASKIRDMRGLFFSDVKKDFLFGIADVTTTPTPLSNDEYELPREIRTVRINRLKAKRVMSGEDSEAKRKHGVFAQLQIETKALGGAALRRGFVAKGHGGQRRAFKVKLIGEGVNDYSGPYREVFTEAIEEVVDVNQQGTGSLGVLDPTPNSSAEIGENRGLYMFSLNDQNIALSSSLKHTFSKEEHRIRQSFFSLTAPRDESSREVEEALVFLGRITGTAFRHGIPLDLPLPLESVWKAIVEEASDQTLSLNELDILAVRQRKNQDEPSALLWWQQRMLNSFVEGLANVLPVEVLTLFSGEELRDLICGNPEVDVDLLRRVVEYEGYSESDDVVGYFWDTLREFSNDERKKFLQFVWARNRLPMKESDFDAPFKIMKDSSSKGDQALPSASTCFFSLTLPKYSSRDLLKQKLVFAINNVATMETDFNTNSVEIAEGYKTF